MFFLYITSKNGIILTPEVEASLAQDALKKTTKVYNKVLTK